MKREAEDQIRRLLAFFAPNDFADNPLRAGLNQMGHVLVGAFLAYHMPLTAAVFAAFAWEAWQLLTQGSSIGDSAADALFWVLGAFLIGWYVLSWPVVIACAVAFGLVWGFITCKMQQNKEQ